MLMWKIVERSTKTQRFRLYIYIYILIKKNSKVNVIPFKKKVNVISQILKFLHKFNTIYDHFFSNF